MPIASAMAWLEGASDSEKFREHRRTLFARMQLKGHIAMCEGGGAAPLHILIETANGWLVRVTLTKSEARALANLLLNGLGAE